MKIEEILIKDLIKGRIKTLADLESFKRRVSKKYKIPCPTNIKLLQAYHKLSKKRRVKKSKILEGLLKTRPIRSLSGIVNVSVLTKPYPCPAACVFCPTEKGFPKSYVSGEPAAQRAKNLKFDPYLQVKKRLEMLIDQGHQADKVELRIIGGTFSFYPEKYKIWFLKRCFDGANNKNSKELNTAQKINEKTKHRIVGISIETKPNLITEKEIKNLRELGVTMVELGIQSVFDPILKHSKTGFLTKDTVRATQLLKDAGFKVMYQIMPNLPKSSLEKDKKVFEEIFKNPDFGPDWLKIYPCVVLKNTRLYQLWRAKKHKTYSDKQLISLLKHIKIICPKWIRIARIYRDIPRQKIVSGCQFSNLRELIKEEMEKQELFCFCLRCREIKTDYSPKEKIYLFGENYNASVGKEIFLSFENKSRKKLYSFLRLRLPFQSKNHFFPVLRNVAIIRELHTYGQSLAIGEKGIAPQHRGLGKKLIKEAEKIAKNSGFNKIAVISGIGARNYYRKLGYKLKNTYMIKTIRQNAD